MEVIKDIIKQFYPLLILCSCVLFVIYVFFSAGEDGNEGVFENVGEIYAPMIGSDAVEKDSLQHLGSSTDANTPVVKYNSGAKSVGDCVSFRSLFLVEMQDGRWISGDEEDGFALYLEDIKNKSGNSVLERLSSQEIEELEEIPAPFIYDKENDLLYVYASGVYQVQIKVYGAAGGMQTYEFNLPVEI